jgi:hypothetical protein
VKIKQNTAIYFGMILVFMIMATGTVSAATTYTVDNDGIADFNSILNVSVNELKDIDIYLKYY